jgi:2'-5' RNA ligase
VPRLHVAVALLVPEPAAHDVDVLRRALGAPDAEVERVPPHLTLVPPFSLRAADLGAALSVLRSAAATTGPLTLRLGPVASFDPVTPTMHLSLGNPLPGDAGEHALVALRTLRDAVRQGPLHRSSLFPFVPHVTLLEQAPLHRIRAARLALDRVAFSVTFDGLSLLSQREAPDGSRRWRPLADVDLGGVRTKGRGGLPIELATGTLLDPEAEGALRAAGLTPPPTPDADVDVDADPGARPRVVVARMGGEVVGVTWGSGGDERAVLGPLDPDLLAAAWAEAVRAPDRSAGEPSEQPSNRSDRATGRLRQSVTATTSARQPSPASVRRISST